MGLLSFSRCFSLTEWYIMTSTYRNQELTCWCCLHLPDKTQNPQPPKSHPQNFFTDWRTWVESAKRLSSSTLKICECGQGNIWSSLETLMPVILTAFSAFNHNKSLPLPHGYTEVCHPESLQCFQSQQKFAFTTWIHWSLSSREPSVLSIMTKACLYHMDTLKSVIPRAFSAFNHDKSLPLPHGYTEVCHPESLQCFQSQQKFAFTTWIHWSLSSREPSVLSIMTKACLYHMDTLKSVIPRAFSAFNHDKSLPLPHGYTEVCHPESLQCFQSWQKLAFTTWIHWSLSSREPSVLSIMTKVCLYHMDTLKSVIPRAFSAFNHDKSLPLPHGYTEVCHPESLQCFQSWQKFAFTTCIHSRLLYWQPLMASVMTKRLPWLPFCPSGTQSSQPNTTLGFEDRWKLHIWMAS